MMQRWPDFGLADAPDDVWECVGDLLTLQGEARTATVVGLPNARKARSLVVVDGRRGAASLVWRQFGAGNRSRKLRAGTMAALIVLGLAPRISTFRLEVPEAPAGLGYRDWLSQALPAYLRVGAIVLGPPRANRKPVVLLTDRTGSLVAVAKFGVSEVTRPLVRHEADALKRVGIALHGSVHVPQLLASGSAGRGEALLMAPLVAATPSVRPSRARLLKLVREVGAIDQSSGEDLCNIASHPRLAPLQPRIDEVRQCYEWVETGSFHGDLHPGNLAVAEDGKVILWDWERWGRGAPLGFDLLHHDLQSWITVDGMTPKDAAAALIAKAPEILGPLGVPAPWAPSVARDYLIRLAARYATDNQERAGSPLGAIERWLFPAVLR